MHLKRQGKRALGFWTVPGGIRNYVESSVAMLQYTASKSPSSDSMIEWMKTRFEHSKSEKTILGYVGVLRTLGLIEIDGGKIALLPPGERCLREDPRVVLAEQLRTQVAGVEEVLSALRDGPMTPRKLHDALVLKLGVEWKTPTQTEFRLQWMVNVGLIAEDGDRYRLA